MGWETPAFAHIPLIHGPDGAKLSKRHGALGVDAYRAMGYLPAALRNYLARLGWSQGDKEFFSTGDELIEAFRSRAGASLAGALRLREARKHERPLHAGDGRRRIARRARRHPALSAKGGPEIADKLDEKKKAQLLAAMSGLKERAKTLIELARRRAIPVRRAAACRYDAKARDPARRRADERASRRR